jgi:hypothetical protein
MVRESFSLTGCMIKNKGLKCQVVICDKPAFCKGYCTKHYQQVRFHGKITDKNFLLIPNFCKNIGCGKPVFAKDLCQSCYIKQRQSEVQK